VLGRAVLQVVEQMVDRRSLREPPVHCRTAFVVRTVSSSVPESDDARTRP
jgi:hypothetical protein